MSHGIHIPGDEAAAPGGPLSSDPFVFHEAAPQTVAGDNVPPPPGLSLGTTSLRHQPRPKVKPGPFR